jgi:hypothetical protein
MSASGVGGDTVSCSSKVYLNPTALAQSQCHRKSHSGHKARPNRPILLRDCREVAWCLAYVIQVSKVARILGHVC